MPDARKHIEKAEKYVQKGKIEGALEEYRLAFQEDPSNDSVVELIAELYLKQKNTKSALECYQYLFKKRSEENDSSGTVLMYRKMARLGTQEPEHMLVCARFLEQQKPAEARDLCRTSAKLFLERGQKDMALESYRVLTKLEDTPDAQTRVAELAESLAKRELAAQAFTRAAELLRSGNPDAEARSRAASLLERAHALVPEDPKVRLTLATALLESGNPARAADLLRPLPAKDFPERGRLLSQAYLDNGKFSEAEEVLTSLTPLPPECQELLWRVANGHLGERKGEAAVNVLRRLKQLMSQAKKDKEFLAATEDLQKNHPTNPEMLEFLTSVYREMNRDSQLGETMSRLFDVYLEVGEHGKAAKVLERLLDVSPEDPANSKRLEQLTGKVDEDTYRRLRTFLHPGEAGGKGAPGGPAAARSLDDLITQAELLLVVGQADEAATCLKEIARQFPGEETRNERLHGLFVDAGLAPKPAAPARPAAAPPAAAAAPAAAPQQEEPALEITRVADITRTIHRQATAKGVVATCVNEIGKTWHASRCLVGLCTVGQQPTTALEYCGPGAKAGDAASLAKLITSLVHSTAAGGTLALDDAPAASQLAELAPVVRTMEIKSLLALPLMDGENATGVMALQQCDRRRHWTTNDIALLKTIVDQIVLALSHVKLRSLMKAVADEGSGLLHRSSYVDCLVSEAGRAEKQNSSLCVALLQFGRGHQTVQQFGEEHIDKFMHAAAQNLVAHLRQNDVGVRYDTTTLALVMPGTKGKDTFVVVDRLRKAVSSIHIEERDPLPVTIGIAEAAPPGVMDPVDNVTELINRLEASLEAARKEDGHVKLLMPPALS